MATESKFDNAEAVEESLCHGCGCVVVAPAKVSSKELMWHVVKPLEGLKFVFIFRLFALRVNH